MVQKLTPGLCPSLLGPRKPLSAGFGTSEEEVAEEPLV